MDEDRDFDVGWNTWPLQSVPEVKRLLFNILASPRSIFSQDVPVCHFYNLSISHICMIARLGRDTFDRLVLILSQSSLFLSPRKPQHPVKYQLAAFLIRYGQRGSDTLDVAAKLSIGHGSVLNYCRRVCRAIRELRCQYLKWMNHVRKEVVMMAIEMRPTYMCVIFYVIK